MILGDGVICVECLFVVLCVVELEFECVVGVFGFYLVVLV